MNSDYTCCVSKIILAVIRIIIYYTSLIFIARQAFGIKLT